MPGIAKLSMDLLFGILCVVASPLHDGTIHTVTITERGPIDTGTIEISGGTFTFFDGIGDDKTNVMSLVALDASTSRYRFEQRVEPPQEIELDQLILNRKDFDPKATKPFEFRLSDGSAVRFMRVQDVIYLHLEDTPNTIVLQK